MYYTGDDFTFSTGERLRAGDKGVVAADADDLNVDVTFPGNKRPVGVPVRNLSRTAPNSAAKISGQSDIGGGWLYFLACCATRRK